MRKYAIGDWKKYKRELRKMGMMDPVYDAYTEGQWYGPRNKKNPYPPGKRHDAWNRGKELPREPQR